MGHVVMCPWLSCTRYELCHGDVIATSSITRCLKVRFLLLCAQLSVKENKLPELFPLSRKPWYKKWTLENTSNATAIHIHISVCVGMWPEGADGTDINTCIRSHNSEYLVCGDDFGSLNIFTYPCSKPKVS